MTACSWWNVGGAVVNVSVFVFNVRLARRLWWSLHETMDRYLPGADVVKHLDSDKKE